MLLCLCPVGCLSLEKLNWDSNKINQSGQSYSYITRKVWYDQIWIQNYLGFIVLDLMYMMELFLPFLISIKHILSDQKTPYIDSCWTKLWKKVSKFFPLWHAIRA